MLTRCNDTKHAVFATGVGIPVVSCPWGPAEGAGRQNIFNKKYIFLCKKQFAQVSLGLPILSSRLHFVPPICVAPWQQMHLVWKCNTMKKRPSPPPTPGEIYWPPKCDPVVSLSPVHTVAEKWDSQKTARQRRQSHVSATTSLFCDSVMDRSFFTQTKLASSLATPVPSHLYAPVSR